MLLILSKKIKTLAFALLITVFGSQCWAYSNTYSIFLNELPTRINVADAHKNYAYYVLYQLFDPLFESSYPSKVSSNILERWTSNDNFTRFELCPSKQTRFSNGKILTSAILENNLKRLVDKHYLQKPIRISDENDCVILEYSFSFPNLFAKLSTLDSAIIDPATLSADIQVGVSDFNISSLSRDMITMERITGTQPNNIHKIVFIKQTPGKSRVVSGYFPVTDYNRVPFEEVPFFIKLLYRKYEVPLMKTYVLVINNSSERVRSILQNCLDINRLRELFMPGRKQFMDVGSLVPIGVAGAEPSSYMQTCHYGANDSEPRILKFLSFKQHVSKQLQQYFDVTLKQYGIKMEVVDVDLEQMAHIIFKGNRAYDATIIGFDAAYPDPRGFFDYFFQEDKRLVSQRNKYIADLFQESSVSTVHTNDSLLVRNANQYLLKSHQILPLFQEVRELYFPENITFTHQDPVLLHYIKVSNVKIAGSD